MIQFQITRDKEPLGPSTVLQDPSLVGRFLESTVPATLFISRLVPWAWSGSEERTTLALAPLPLQTKTFISPSLTQPFPCACPTSFSSVEVLPRGKAREASCISCIELKVSLEKRSLLHVLTYPLATRCRPLAQVRIGLKPDTGAVWIGSHGGNQRVCPRVPDRHGPGLSLLYCMTGAVYCWI